VATLGELQEALFPDARVLGAPRLTRERAAREVGWVRILKAGATGFDGLAPTSQGFLDLSTAYLTKK